MQSYTLPAYFGGVSLTEESTITEVKAIALSYFLDVSEDWRAVVGDKWEKKFLENVEKYADIYYPDLEVTILPSMEAQSFCLCSSLLHLVHP